MNILKKQLIPAVAALALSFMAGGASAATCSLSDVQTSTACIGATAPSSGSAQASDLNGLGGFSDWTEVEKLVDDSTASPKTFDGAYFALKDDSGNSFDGNDDVKSGTWELINAIAGKTYALALKGGTEFAAYILSGTSGTWTTAALTEPGKGGAHGLSNAVLFSRGDPSGGVIPLPAGLPLMLSALGIGGLIARRKRKAA